MSVSSKQYQLWSSWAALVVLVVLMANQEYVFESIEGDTHVFRYASRVLIGMSLIGLISARVAWLLRGSPRGMMPAIKMHLAFVGMLLGFIGVVFFAFFVAEVNSKGFEIRRGVCGLSVRQAEFANIKRIRLLWERHNARRSGNRPYFYLLCEKNDGTDTKMYVSGDRIMRTVAGQILERVGEHGIPVSKPHGADVSRWFAGK